jgi:hypothetical protein
MIRLHTRLWFLHVKCQQSRRNHGRQNTNFTNNLMILFQCSIIEKHVKQFVIQFLFNSNLSITVITCITTGQLIQCNVGIF